MEDNPIKRRAGGQRGNMNAAKTIIPALKRLRKGQPLPEYLERITALADMESEGLIGDLGGLENMTTGQQLMLANWKSARSAELLIWNALLTTGSPIEINKDQKTWDLQPGLQRLSGFLGQQRAALLALGLERRARNITPLGEYLKGAHLQESESQKEE